MRGLLAGDARRGLTAAVFGAVALAAFEYVVSLAVAHGGVSFLTLFRFLALDVVLVAVLLAIAAPLTAAAFALPRLLLAARSPERARAYAGPLRRAAESGPATPQAATPWLWALLLTAAGYLAVSYALTMLFQARFKDRQLIAASLAAAQLGVIAVLAALAFLLAAGLRRAGAALAPRLQRWNPLARLMPAAGVMVLAAIPLVFVLLRRMPSLRDVVPWRLLLAAAVYGAAAVVAARRELRLGRRALAVGGGILVALFPPTLWLWGANPEAKYLASTASPPLSRLVDLVRRLNDFDRDGYGSLLGENDCAPFDAAIHPGARDIPDNGIDENCNGRDFSMKGLRSYRRGERMPLPPEFRRDWNVLLITIDALRFDHTGFGGYKKAKGRNTSPRLDELEAHAIDFRFAQAPAAGTMASVPSILVSKFFHSGIALGPERRPMPPKILPQNVMLAEVMKRGGYRTGAILTHEYFNDWGLEQGFDTYDNALGAKHDPFSITSQDVTSKAEAWIAKQGDATNTKWFLWCHYLDPHGRYVAHPGEVQFGGTEEDIYDGEIAYTDKHIGKLLDFLARSPAADKTIIVVTSDHGDGFMEHGFINHGVALYRELIHVPLLVYIPDAEPHAVEGPVANMDILPTLADLAGIDISDLSVEGESLVPQLFYGRDARDRVVFSETNLPDPIRAAISDHYKLVYNLKTNVNELYDLHADPWEKKNLWGRDKAGSDQMKGLLDEWLDRVYYARDPASQAQQVRSAEYLADKLPASAKQVSMQAGGIEVAGWDATPLAPGKDATVTVWLTVAKPLGAVYRLEAELFAERDAGPRLSVRQEKTPAGDGVFPTTKWRPGEYVKETFKLRVPPEAAGPQAPQTTTMSLALRIFDTAHKPVGAQMVLVQLPVALR